MSDSHHCPHCGRFLQWYSPDDDTPGWWCSSCVKFVVLPSTRAAMLKNFALLDAMREYYTHGTLPRALRCKWGHCPAYDPILSARGTQQLDEDDTPIAWCPGIGGAVRSGDRCKWTEDDTPEPLGGVER